MASIQDSTTDLLVARRTAPGLASQLYAPLAITLDTMVIVALAFAAGIGFNLVFNGTVGVLGNYLEFGGLVAVIFCGASLLRGDYNLIHAIGQRRVAIRALYMWSAAVATVVAIGFLTKSNELYSRGAVLALFLGGLFVIPLWKLLMTRLVTFGARVGRVAARRVLLVGHESEVVTFARRYQPWNHGMQIVGMSLIAKQDKDSADRRPTEADIERAVATARALQPDDVVVVLPWSATEMIERTLQAFMTIPASIHLAPERILDRYERVTIEKIGAMASLKLARPPMTGAEVLGKRLIDIVGSGIGLLLLSPLFLIVAILIKLDSPGPAFFTQQRYGFNQRPFRIWKFRSMSTREDGHRFKQATRNDPRITKIGAFIRRTNIDELPQLWNVFIGDMSLVGPRPHPVALDRAFESRIDLYARRHNIKPGITGWAQVNGYRGETDTEEKMRGRVEHDLWYIDNWSFLLDLQILFSTFISKKAFKNAF